MAEKPKIYIDSCCFIDAAKHSLRIVPNSRTQDVWFLWKLLEAHKERDVVLFTSMLSVAECTHADGNMSDSVKSLFSRVLLSGHHVTLIQPTPFIATDARNLRWIHNVMLGGADYLHVASALDRKCIEFLTTDEKISKAAPRLKSLNLTVCEPCKTNLLPDKYKQGNLLDDKVTPIKRTGK